MIEQLKLMHKQALVQELGLLLLHNTRGAASARIRTIFREPSLRAPTQAEAAKKARVPKEANVAKPG